MALFTVPNAFAVIAALSAIACSGAAPSPTSQQSQSDQSDHPTPGQQGDQGCGGLIAASTSFTFTTSTTIPVNPAPNVDVTVSDPSVVQALFQETNDLPVLPPGNYSCPIDFGVVYHLTFEGAAATEYLLEPGGCENVTVVGDSTVVLSASPAYWQTLATALGVPEATIYPYQAPTTATP